MLESTENNAWNTAEIQKLLMVPEAIEDSRLMGRRQRPFFFFGKGEVRNDILEESFLRSGGRRGQRFVFRMLNFSYSVE